MRTHLPRIATAILIVSLLSVAGSAMAQSPTNVPDPLAAPDAFGYSENDVSDEPDGFQDEDNGFSAGDPAGSDFDPTVESLVLDGFVESRIGSPFILFFTDEDVDAVRQNVMPGTSHAEGEQTIYPGQASFEAWWGWWVDTGGGGEYQENTVTNELFNSPPNGAIDDAHDCDEDATWDEFVWRGPDNTCPDTESRQEIQDTLRAFIQPGTHDMHVNTLVVGCSCPDDATLRNNSDHWTEADFLYEYVQAGDQGDEGFQRWRQNNGFSRYEYDQSFFVTTQVVTSVNPKETICNDPECEDDRAHFDPYKPGKNVADEDHAVDKDIYSTVDPTVAELYRTAVWDPDDPRDDDRQGDETDSPLDDADEEGLKHAAKYPVHQAWLNTQGSVFENVSQAQESSEPFQGAADDAVYGPYKHEPNHADDTHTASLDADYGGLEDYYSVNSEDYTAYQDNELFWHDAKIGVNDFPIWIPECCAGYNGFDHYQPEVPDADRPAESTIQEEDDDQTQSPGLLYAMTNVGTWYDANGDTWVGDAHDGTDDAYDGGTDDDPNDYSSSEFRGTCTAEVRQATLIPTDDIDNDGVGEWGTTGVYIWENWVDGNPYSDAVMDVGGEEAHTATDPLRDTNATSGTANYWTPEQDDRSRLSHHRMEGPIELDDWFNGCISQPNPGDIHSSDGVVFPAGNTDFGFKAKITVELTDKSRQSLHGTNQGTSLTGATLTDVDEFHSITGSAGD